MKKAHELYGTVSHEEFSKHCLRYGTIVKDIRGETPKCHWRKLVVSIDGWHAHIYKENGNTINACLTGAK